MRSDGNAPGCNDCNGMSGPNGLWHQQGSPVDLWMALPSHANLMQRIHSVLHWCPLLADFYILLHILVHIPGVPFED
jgi:hypothetical protein